MTKKVKASAKKPKPVNAWIVVSEAGTPVSIGQTRRQAWFYAGNRVELKGFGYRCIRVLITPLA